MPEVATEDSVLRVEVDGDGEPVTVFAVDPETAAGIAAAIAKGSVSAEAITRRALERIDAWQPVSNAFSQVHRDGSLAAARAADAAAAAGRSLGPLHGVPVAVKDLFDVAGHETTGCCRAYAGTIARADADLVRRLRAAGAVIVGKTNQHELACGATNIFSACGTTRNPWDPDRITGGSSGGSGAAVAARVVPLALATDTGGSIRMPASLCGCWGLKPTHGRFPAGGMMPLAPSLDCPGPMAASAQDLTLWWEAMGMPPVPAELPEPLRAGVLGDWFRDWSHPEMWGAVEAVAKALRGLGWEVSAVDGTGLEDVRDVWTDVAWPEFARAHAGLLDRIDELLPQTAASLRHGASVSPDRRAEARRRAGEYSIWFDARLSGVDLLVAPATPIPAPPIPASGGEETRVEVEGGRVLDWLRGGLAWFTEPVNLAGIPALAVPAGRTPGGLPLGVQLIARRGADELLLAVAGRLEAAGGPFRTGTPALPT